MNQPSLGKKISELRKAQGLTQKELVDKCNLNVRTLQRIESGEVTPRSYTLKLLLQTLNYEGQTSSSRKSDFRHWIERVFPFNYKTTVSLIVVFIITITTIIFFYQKDKNTSIVDAKEEVTRTQKKMIEWVNSQNLDSILSKYRVDACVSNNVCGKENIKNLFKRIFSEGYKIIKYTSISMDVNDGVAFEKYTSTYQYKGATHQQFGITEWHLSNGEWFIVSEIYND
ncbi:MAG: helix-turn-helix transcriptional regulator [Flavobacteriaceae bacterium]|nr:helix-turn-helix transcriptional regulator [Flavobacteriaceae bacterium]